MKITAKRRRGRQEIKDEKEAEEQKQAMIADKLARFDEMLLRVQNVEENQDKFARAE